VGLFVDTTVIRPTPRLHLHTHVKTATLPCASIFFLFLLDLKHHSRRLDFRQPYQPSSTQSSNTDVPICSDGSNGPWQKASPRFSATINNCSARGTGIIDRCNGGGGGGCLWMFSSGACASHEWLVIYSSSLIPIT
jgi:hypothetical protein